MLNGAAVDDAGDALGVSVSPPSKSSAPHHPEQSCPIEGSRTFAILSETDAFRGSAAALYLHAAFGSRCVAGSGVSAGSASSPTAREDVRASVYGASVRRGGAGVIGLHTGGCHSVSPHGVRGLIRELRLRFEDVPFVEASRHSCP